MSEIKKQIIVNEYFNNKLYTTKNLAEKFNVSTQYVNRILKDFRPVFKEEVENLYYQEKKNITEITNILNISYPTVIKILQNNDKYCKEKKNRKKRALISKRKCKNTYIQNKRREERELTYYQMYMGNFLQKMTIKISEENLSKNA